MMQKIKKTISRKRVVRKAVPQKSQFCFGKALTSMAVIFSMIGQMFLPTIGLAADPTVNYAPSAIGNYNGWAVNPSGADKVAAVSDNIDNNYITAGDNNLKQSFKVSGASLPANSMITKLTVRALAKKLSGEPKFAFLVSDGTNDSIGLDQIFYDEYYMTYSRAMTANPLNGQSWQLGDLDNLNFGIKKTNGSGSIALTKLWVVVEYIQGVDSVANPVMDKTCGLDVVLVIDRSSSIDSDEMAAQKAAFLGLVDDLSGTPTQFGVVSFGNSGDKLQELSFDISAVKGAINGITYSPEGTMATNWQDGLIKAREVLGDASKNRAGNPDLVIFASDGNPTVNNESAGTGSVTDGKDLINAILAANGIKTAAPPARIISLGVGGAVAQANMEAVSGAQADGDYYPVANYDVLGAALKSLAGDVCGGTINVKKMIDADGDLATTGDQTAGGEGWNFSVNGTNYTTDGSSAISAPIVCTNGPFSVIETNVNSGYKFAGANCVRSTDGANVGTYSETDRKISEINVAVGEYVNCVFYNSPLPDEPVLGCTDQVATNYDPLATQDNGSCQYPPEVIPGCTDPDALNYNDQANQDDGSCQYPAEVIPGCTDQAALNYNAQATQDDGSCQYPEGPVCGDGVKAETEECEDGNDQNGDGCSNVCAIEVTKVAGECGPAAKVYPYVYEAEYYQEDRCSSGTIGLQMIAFPNPGQTVEWTCYGENGGADVSCFASRDLAPAPDPILGCVDSAATNYNANATQDDGSCRYPQPSSGGSSSGGGISGDFAPGFGPNAGGGIKPQVAGASIDLDDIARQIDEIRQKIADIAGQIPPAIKGVLGAATQVATGVCDTALPQGGDYGDSWITPDIYAKLRAEFCSPDLVLLPTKN